MGAMKRIRRAWRVLIGADKRRPGAVAAADWRQAAEKLVVMAMPTLLDESRDAELVFTPELKGRSVYRHRHEVVKWGLPGVIFEEEPTARPDYAFFWGFGRTWSNIRSALACAESGALPVLCEDGFLRSADTWANPNVPPKFRQGCSVIYEKDNVFRVTMPINPYSLMEVVDKVYVCSTQMGFEALMAGKEVHVYGMPFCAGWGLTHDAQKKVTRTRMRALEEVFYIFYVLYTHWIDVDSGRPCSIDRAIDNLVRIREEYSRLRNADGDAKGATIV